MLKALGEGKYPKSYKPTEEKEYNQALRQARDQIIETAWKWEILLWITANNPAEYLQLQQLPITDVASARLHSLYNS